MTDSRDDRPSSKVARLIADYELDGLGDDLEARWTGEGAERTSLRDLADLFNRRLVEAALRDAGMRVLERDVETTYEALTDDDVSPGVRTDTRTRLRRNGVDVDALESAFVTYQAVRSYLQSWRDAEYREYSDSEKLRKDRETIERLSNRALSVTEDRVEKLRETGRLDLPEFSVFLDLRVLCQRCETQYDVSDLLERGGCDCTNV
ncbi:hypothetical protein HALDL1_04540 [Halobacterium sp. DL1]|jgi:hypothetical protein|nr:hypothetical protein HALDL1_04540 [Halobacterium sp. DL1]